MNLSSKTLSIFLLAVMAIVVLTTVSASTSHIFADEDEEDDEIEGEVGEENETITKLIATGTDKKLTTMIKVPKNEEPAKPIPIITQPIIPEASAQKVSKNQTLGQKQESQQSDKSMKLVLGDIVLPISDTSDFQLELPFSKITVEPVK